jgi:hypothetical protein
MSNSSATSDASSLKEPVPQDGLQRLPGECTVENDFSRHARDTSDVIFMTRAGSDAIGAG